MDQDKKEQLLEKAIEKNGAISMNSIKFKNGFIRDIKPGQKHTEKHTVEEIADTLRDLHEDEWVDFRRRFGFDLTKIEEIGIEKFIKALDWSNRFEVTSWKTDKFHFLPCVSCNDDFGIWETHTTLCEKCKDDYFYELIEYTENLISLTAVPASNTPKAMFIESSEFRDLFKKSNPDFVKAVQEIEADRARLLKLLITNVVISDIILVAIGMTTDEGDGIEILHSFPSSKLSPIIKECMISERVKLSRDLPGYHNYVIQYFERYKFDQNNYNIYNAAIDCTNAIIREQISLATKK